MREKYESLSLATLKDLAKARGLKGISTLRKPELIDRMLQEDEREAAVQKEILTIQVKDRYVRNFGHVKTERRHSLTVERRQTVFWKYFRMDMVLSAVRIICRAKMISMFHRLRSVDLI